MAQGPERAFRFKGIKLMDGSVCPAHYANDLNNPPPSQCMSKCTGWWNADVMPKPEAATNTELQANANAQPEAPSSRNPNAQLSGRKLAKGKAKQKQPGWRSTAEQAPNSEPLISSQITDTTQSNYVQVNQPTMDILAISHSKQLLIRPHYSSILNISHPGSNWETHGTCTRVS